MKLPEELLDSLELGVDAYEAIVRDCAKTAHMALGGPSHKVSENTHIYRAQDHALTVAYLAILARYSLKPEDGHE